MQYYDTDLSETMSIITSTDTASNWSKPVKRKPKGRNTISAKTRPSMSKKLHSKKFVENNLFLTKTPCLKLHRYHLKICRPSNLSVKQTEALIETINDESRVVHYLWPRIHQRTAELEAEIAHLQERLRQLQTEEVDIKRKRWCRNCQQEATYIHTKRFYCSTYCEEQFSKIRNQQ